jgi:hypothetical protein
VCVFSLLIALESGWGVVRSVPDMSALVTRFIKRPQRFRRLRHAMQQARCRAVAPRRGPNRTACLFKSMRLGALQLLHLGALQLLRLGAVL